MFWVHFCKNYVTVSNVTFTIKINVLKCWARYKYSLLKTSALTLATKYINIRNTEDKFLGIGGLKILIYACCVCWFNRLCSHGFSLSIMHRYGKAGCRPTWHWCHRTTRQKFFSQRWAAFGSTPRDFNLSVYNWKLNWVCQKGSRCPNLEISFSYMAYPPRLKSSI